MAVSIDQQQATACLWHALECLARDERAAGLLVPGRIKIAAAIDACVEDLPVMAIVGGELVVSTDDAPSGLLPYYEHVLALALNQLPFSRRVALQEDLVKHVTEYQSLPAVTSQSHAAVHALMERIRMAFLRGGRRTCRFERTVVK